MQWAAYYHNNKDVLKNILDQFTGSVKLSLIIYLQ